MLFVYPAIFHKEEESYWVEFPDLKGCNTYGSTIPEAMEMAQEALTGYLLSLLEHGDTIAPPSISLRTISVPNLSLHSLYVQSPASCPATMERTASVSFPRNLRGLYGFCDSLSASKFSNRKYSNSLM